MKKIIILACILSLVNITNSLQAQSAFTSSLMTPGKSFDKGTSVINLGVGFGYSIGYGSGSSSSPVISGTYEYGVAKAGPGVIGVGLALGYQGSSYTYSDYQYTYKERWTTSAFGLRGTYHPDFCNGKKYDVYGVLQLTYYNYGYSYSSNPVNPYYQFRSSLNNGLGLGILVGGRYYFTDNIGAFLELGYDISYLKLGVSFKFGGN